MQFICLFNNYVPMKWMYVWLGFQNKVWFVVRKSFIKQTLKLYQYIIKSEYKTTWYMVSIQSFPSIFHQMNEIWNQFKFHDLGVYSIDMSQSPSESKAFFKSIIKSDVIFNKFSFYYSSQWDLFHWLPALSSKYVPTVMTFLFFMHEILTIGSESV